jgi:hypothetical protein
MRWLPKVRCILSNAVSRFLVLKGQQRRARFNTKCDSGAESRVAFHPESGHVKFS